jgi:hypothetical protein
MSIFRIAWLLFKSFDLGIFDIMPLLLLGKDINPRSYTLSKYEHEFSNEHFLSL